MYWIDFTYKETLTTEDNGFVVLHPPSIVVYSMLSPSPAVIIRLFLQYMEYDNL